MMRFLPRPTYANVMATIAVFIALGGSAYAATQLKKNSVGSNQLKKNAVTASKIKNNAVTTAKIGDGAVTGEKIGDGAVTGSNINLGSLGTVPSATEASATNGVHMAKINFISGENAAPTTVFSGGGLTLTAECKASELEFTATTSVANSEIYESGNFLNVYAGGLASLNPGDIENVGKKIGDKTQNEVQGQLVYQTPAGAVVTAQFILNGGSIFEGSAKGCSVEGIAEFSS